MSKRKLTNVSKYCSSKNLQISFKKHEYNTCSSSAYSKLLELDSTFIGTTDYMGIAYFWDHEVKHTMRDVSPKFRKTVHDTAIAWGLKFTESEHKVYPQLYLETTQELRDIIDLCIIKFKWTAK